jgi:ribosomal protein L7/L12
MSVSLIQLFFKRFVGQDSWAAEGLEKMGEKLESPKVSLPIDIDENLINQPPSDKIKKLCEEILKLKVVEVRQLFNQLQKRLGITDEMIMSSFGGGGGSGGQAQSTAPAEAAEVEAPKEEEVFGIKIRAFDQKAKIIIIKEVRAITGLGLKEVLTVHIFCPMIYSR